MRRETFKTLDQVVVDHIVLGLKMYEGNVSDAARHLGLHRRTLQRMMRRYRIKVKRA